MTKKKIIWSAFLVCIGIVMSWAMCFSCSEQVKNPVNKGRIKEIDRQTLVDVLESSETLWIYIGRPSCPDCIAFYPVLLEKVQISNKSILYYNTECKASAKAEMSSFVKKLGIKEIPSVLKIENKQITVYNMLDSDDVEMFNKEF